MVCVWSVCVWSVCVVCVCVECVCGVWCVRRCIIFIAMLAHILIM